MGSGSIWRFSSLPLLSARVLRMAENVVTNNGTKNKYKVLFCGHEFPSAFEYTHKLLVGDDDIELEFHPRSELLDRVASFNFIVPRMCQIDKEIIMRARNTKVICQFGVGLEGVDIPAATAAGIKVARIASSSNRMNAVSCAEHCIYLMLSLLRKQQAMADSVAAMRLGDPTGDTLWGKTVLIVGFGAIGEELAFRLQPFNVKVLGVRRSWSRTSFGSVTGSYGRMDVHVERGGPEDLLSFVSRADLIVMSALLTDETRGMANKEFYSNMKKNSMMVNIGRGGLLDYGATLAALQSGHLGGLAIDVAWKEPFDPHDPIATHPRTVITPHVGGVTHPSYFQMASVMCETIRQAKAEQDLTYVEIVN